VNLLLANQKRSEDPGDDRAMMAARAAFLAAGHYAPVAEALADAAQAERSDVILEAGCGEGYYLRALRRRLGSEPTFCGLDISRHAILAAAKQDRDSLYVIGNAYRLPILDAHLDLVVTHFAPLNPAEVARALRPGGRLIVGGPGPRHLFELKAQIYDRPAEHEPPTPPAGFSLIAEQRLTYDLNLRDPSDIANLLQMTPYVWSADRATQERLATLTALDTRADIVFHTYRRD
jgi:23S rRNA (guanine745-N1)-methyltransferase